MEFTNSNIMEKLKTLYLKTYIYNTHTVQDEHIFEYISKDNDEIKIIYDTSNEYITILLNSVQDHVKVNKHFFHVIMKLKEKGFILNKDINSYIIK